MRRKNHNNQYNLGKHEYYFELTIVPQFEENARCPRARDTGEFAAGLVEFFRRLFIKGALTVPITARYSSRDGDANFYTDSPLLSLGVFMDPDTGVNTVNCPLEFPRDTLRHYAMRYEGEYNAAARDPYDINLMFKVRERHDFDSSVLITALQTAVGSFFAVSPATAAAAPELLNLTASEASNLQTAINKAYGTNTPEFYSTHISL
jgi:hypothetical protein